jgi:hypothetical protein
MASIESQIQTELRTILLTLPWPKYVEFERIRIKLTDFREHELPAIQFYDLGKTYTRLQGRSDVVWSILVEIIMKKSTTDLVNQGLLQDRMNDVHNKVGEFPQLGLTTLPVTEGTMTAIVPFGESTDLHMEDPFYTGGITFNASYLKPYSDTC